MLKHLTEETVEEICELVKARNAAEKGPQDVTFPPNNLSKLAASALSGPSSEQQALINKLLSLPKEQMNELGALMFLGRESGSTFKATLRHAESTLDKNAPYYIGGKLPLDDYLHKGLMKLAAERD